MEELINKTQLSPKIISTSSRRLGGSTKKSHFMYSTLSFTSLDLTRLHHSHLHALFLHISRATLPLQSLNLSGHPAIPSNGFRILAKKVTTLKSLTCSHMGSLRNSDLILIAQCFPFLEHLDLSFPEDTDNSTFPVSDVGVKALSLALPMLLSVDLSGNFFINDASILSLCKMNSVTMLFHFTCTT